ncbi:hypothetical protein CR513_15538, partial [Mucuna pruriens]
MERNRETRVSQDPNLVHPTKVPFQQYQEVMPTTYVKVVMAMQVYAPRSRDPIISFLDEGYEDMLPLQDDPMVISIIVADYKVESVLVNQGSSANSTFQKLELLIPNLAKCSSTLFGFVGEHVEIRGIIELENTFGMGSNAKTIPITFTIVNAWASYNVILE